MDENGLKKVMTALKEHYCPHVRVAAFRTILFAWTRTLSSSTRP